MTWDEHVILMLKRREREQRKQALREQTREACKRYGEQIAAMYQLPSGLSQPPQ